MRVEGREAAAARDGDFDALIAVLDPEVLLRADRGVLPAGESKEVRGARTVAKRALAFSRLVAFAQLALVNGAAGIVSWRPGGKPFSIMGFTIASGKIVVIDILADPERLSRLDLAVLRNEGAGILAAS